MIHNLVIHQSDLSSRSAASKKRVEILKVIQRGGKVSLDFSAVKSVSQSYADELFGVLSVRLGIDPLIDSVRISKASRHVLKSIAEAIQARNEEYRAA